ncbi:DUF349 domain-containing protein [Corynebacterium kozikiae]|uniref:DUF349 domain-containing protein n=1 Tax=Corynebacterium kozikiae TaxID=2968469 RepID=UPI00211CE42C|nr:DUF349 domain-containing protein [Corynebacterium sp. 76QC2CO]MCQ9342446.1 DUF349 domain-containing protein [Corynebacterium sp. 76QC2CO]
MSSPTPKPGPRPGTGARPRPGAGTGPRPSAAASATKAHPPVASDPSKFGRVDAEGNVFLTVDGQERQIAQWQAGTPEEGLRHFGARFDDLATEVSLMETRLNTSPEDAKHLKAKAEELIKQLPEAAVIGDIKALQARLETVVSSADAAGEQAEAAKQARRAEAIARKEALLTEAEQLAEESTDWKQAGDRIRDILQEWKTIKGIDRKTDDALWKRYSRARDAFNRRRGSHFADLDRSRAAARKVKEELVAQAEALRESTDWNETAAKFRELMGSWKKAGRAQREVDDKLWGLFKAAQDAFFEARNAATNERDREFQANADAKNALLEQYDSLIDPTKDLEGARAKLRELQEKWEEIGFVPRNQVREFEDKIAALEARVEQAADAQWRRTDPEAQARARQFLDKVEEFKAQADAAKAKGNEKKAAELLAQAQQWQEWADAAVNAVENR